MFSERPQSPLRHRIDASYGREILLMPAYRQKFAGAKVLSIIPRNADSTRPVISGLFLLFDFETGVPLATMHAGELTAWRTAAVSALAAKALARDDASELTVLGAGHLAPFLALALVRVRPIRRVNIWARRVSEAERVTQLVRDKLDGVEVSACTDLRQAVDSADILSAATRSQAPLISGNWVRPGAHLDLVGGYRPDMRELDDAGIQRGRIFVDTVDGVLAEAGDLIDPLERGVISKDAIAGDLSALVSGEGRRASADEITIFKSVGTGLSDLAVAIAVWEESLSAHSHLR
jgi:ornithine cyclodeaminase